MITISRFASATLSVLSGFLIIHSVLSTPNRDLENSGVCHDKMYYFQSEVYVDFNGFDTDASDLTMIRWDSLEQQLRVSYNSLSEDLCDDSYRRIVDVSINVQPDGQLLIRRGGDQYTISFTVEAVCRGCDPSSVTLFSPPNTDYFRKLISFDGATIESGDENPLNTVLQRRRLLDSKSEKKEKYVKSYKGGKSKGAKDSKSGIGKGGEIGESGDERDAYYGKGGDYGKGGSGKGNANGNGKGGSGKGEVVDGRDDVFACECRSEDPKLRAPTESEFAVVYGAAIRSVEEPHSQRHGSGVIVDNIEDVMEVEDVACSIVQETFESLVAVEFFGSYEDITDEERFKLENNFVWAYNHFQDKRCDTPVFRTAKSAEIFFMVDPTETDQSTFVYLLNIQGTCRGEGCSKNNDLLLFSAADDNMLRNLQFVDGAECSCPKWRNDYGPPSTLNMEVNYFQIVQELRSRGQLPSIDASGYIREIGDGATTPFPTMSPTKFGETRAPTKTATNPPTRAPFTLSPTKFGETRSPSKNPTNPPTRAPFTLSPTKFGETRAPTIPPTNPPTRAPFTMSPTKVGETRRPTAQPTTQPVTLAPTRSKLTLPPFTLPPAKEGDTKAPTSGPTTLAPTGTAEPTISAAPTTSESPSLSQEPSISEGPSISEEPSISQEPSASLEPSESLEPSVSNAPTSAGDKQPSDVPSDDPINDTLVPSSDPSGPIGTTQTPSGDEDTTASPSAFPTTLSPTESAPPTGMPSGVPTVDPESTGTTIPSLTPSGVLTVDPDSNSTSTPSEFPTVDPDSNSTLTPSEFTTQSPTASTN